MRAEKKLTFLVLKIILTLPIFTFFFWLVYTKVLINYNILDFGNFKNLIALGIIFLIFLFVLFLPCFLVYRIYQVFITRKFVIKIGFDNIELFGGDIKLPLKNIRKVFIYEDKNLGKTLAIKPKDENISMENLNSFSKNFTYLAKTKGYNFFQKDPILIQTKMLNLEAEEILNLINMRIK